MTGTDHKRNAERLLALNYRERADVEEAQVHALLAIAEAIADLGEHKPAERLKVVEVNRFDRDAVRYTATVASDGANHD